MTDLRPGLEALPDSPYAAQLRTGSPGARFPRPLEAEYLRDSLRENRLLIRVVCTLTALLLVLRLAELVIGLGPMRRPGASFELVLVTSLALLWLAWGARFERWYLPFATVLVPLRNVVIALQIVFVAASGQLDNLMVLPLLFVGPMYFLGLPYRTAIVTCALTLLSAIGASLAFHLAPAVAFRSQAFLAVTLLTFAIAARQLERRSRRAFLENRLVAELAQQDVLTWTKNRRVFDESLPRLWRQAASDRHPLAMLLIDVDYFKPYNDRYGHQAGDAVLRQVAQAIESCARRPFDLVARYGGEEFAVILYDTDRTGAAAAAENMRQAVERLAIEHRGSHVCDRLTISIGVAVVEPTAWRNPYGALQLADEALYQAKSKGRNRTELMDDVEHRLLVTGEFSKELIETLRRDAAAR